MKLSRPSLVIASIAGALAVLIGAFGAHGLPDYLVGLGVDAETVATIEPFLKFGEKLGVILSQLGPDHADALEVRYSGNVADLDTALISRSILKGYFLRALGDEINTINAPGVAEGRGLKFCESRKEGVGEFADLLEVKVTKGKGKVVIAGTFFGGSVGERQLLQERAGRAGGGGGSVAPDRAAGGHGPARRRALCGAARG